MQTSTLLQMWLLTKKLQEFKENSHHPPLHCNEEEIEGFGLWKKEVQALKRVLTNHLSLSQFEGNLKVVKPETN